jgi:hypothetical protein
MQPLPEGILFFKRQIFLATKIQVVLPLSCTHAGPGEEGPLSKETRAVRCIHTYTDTHTPTHIHICRHTYTYADTHTRT